MSDPGNEARARLRKDWEENRGEWEDRGGMRDWTDILITNCVPRPDVQGKNIAEIAADEGKDPLETALDLIVVSEGQVECVCFGQLEDNVRILIRHPLVVVGSDGDALAPYVCWPGVNLTRATTAPSRVCWVATCVRRRYSRWRRR